MNGELVKAVGVPFGFTVRAVFLSFENRGMSVKAEGAGGTAIVNPEQATQSPLKLADRVLLMYEFRYVAASRGGNFQSSAGLRAVLVAVTPDMSPASQQANLVEIGPGGSGQQKR